MNTRFLCVLALHLTLSGGASLRAQEGEEFKDAAQLLAEIDSITPQLQAEIALFREHALAGKDADGWTKEKRAAALKLIEDILTPSPDERPGAALIDRIRTATQRLYLFAPRDIPSAVFYQPARNPIELTQRLAARIAALMSLRGSLFYRYNDELIDYAAAVWLRAKTPEDLKPVSAAFSALKERDLRLLSSSDFARMTNRGMSPPFNQSNPVFARMAEFSRVRNELFEAYTLTSSATPLILPDPETKPEEFWKARKALYWLRKIGFTFLKKPRVEVQCNVLNLRFRKASITARELVERLILEEAPLEQFGPALTRLHHFEEQPLNILADPPENAGKGSPVPRLPGSHRQKYERLHFDAGCASPNHGRTAGSGRNLRDTQAGRLLAGVLARPKDGRHTEGER